MKTVKQLTFGDTVLNGVSQGDDAPIDFSFGSNLASFTSHYAPDTAPNAVNKLEFGCGCMSLISDNGSDDSAKRYMEMALNQNDGGFEFKIVGSGNDGDINFVDMTAKSEYDSIADATAWIFSINSDIVHLLPDSKSGYVRFGSATEDQQGNVIYPLEFSSQTGITFNSTIHITSGCMGTDGTYYIDVSNDTDSDGNTILVLKQ